METKKGGAWRVRWFDAKGRRNMTFVPVEVAPTAADAIHAAMRKEHFDNVNEIRAEWCSPEDIARWESMIEPWPAWRVRP